MAGEFGIKRQFIRFQGLDSILGYVQIKATSWSMGLVGIQHLKGEGLEL